MASGKLAWTSIPKRQLKLPQLTTTIPISLPTSFCIHFFLYISTCISHTPIWDQTLHVKYKIPLHCSRTFPNSFLTHRFTESFSSAYNYATIFFHPKKNHSLVSTSPTEYFLCSSLQKKRKTRSKLRHHKIGKLFKLRTYQRLKSIRRKKISCTVGWV